MKFEHMYERIEPRIMAFARGQGGMITLGQLRLLIIHEFGQDERCIKAKIKALEVCGKIQGDVSPGQFYVMDYKPKKSNGGEQ